MFDIQKMKSTILIEKRKEYIISMKKKSKKKKCLYAIVKDAAKIFTKEIRNIEK